MPSSTAIARLRMACVAPRLLAYWRTFYNHYSAWRNDGTWEAINVALRARIHRAAGRERHVVDTLGLLLDVKVAAASDDDGTAAPQVLSKLDRASHPPPAIAPGGSEVSQSFAGSLDVRARLVRDQDHGPAPRELGVPGDPRSRVVERTFAWLGR